MAFTDDKYYFDFADVQGRTHRVTLFEDGYTGSSTELTASADPLTYLYGEAGDNEYRVIADTALEMRVEVDSDTVFDDLFGSAEQSWVVQWEVGSALMWRGYLLTDDMEMALDSRSTLVLRAVCGTTFLKDIKWTPGTSGRQTFIDGIQDLLGDLDASGVTLNGYDHKIGAAANWHAYDGGSAVSGNSFARYKFDEERFENPDVAGEHYTNRYVLEQLVGVFGAKLYNGAGRWRIAQRDLITGASYAMDKYTAAGSDEGTDETISEVEITGSGTNPILAGAGVQGVQPYQAVPIVYVHGSAGGSLLTNPDFSIWPTADAAPTGWTRVRDGAQTLDQGDVDPGGDEVRGGGVVVRGPRGIGGFE